MPSRHSVLSFPSKLRQAVTFSVIFFPEFIPNSMGNEIVVRELGKVRVVTEKYSQEDV